MGIINKAMEIWITLEQALVFKCLFWRRNNNQGKMSFSLCNKKTLRETWKHSLLLLLLPHPYIHPGFLLHFTHSLICHITRIFMVGSVSSSCLEVLMRPGFNLFVMPSNHHHHHHHELVHLARLVHPIRSSHPSLQVSYLYLVYMRENKTKQNKTK